VILDARPLRHNGFRDLWLSATLGATSGQLAATALLVQVTQAGQSLVLTGLVGFTAAVATVLGNLLGGTLADHRDRRGVVLAGTAVAALAALGLAASAATAPDRLAVLFGLVAVQTFAGAVAAPARRTFLRRTLPADLVPAGVGLLHLSFQAGLLGGPVLAAVLLAYAGPAPAYLLDGLAGLAALVLLRRLPRGRGAAPPPGVALAQVWRRPVLRTVLLSDLAATVLAMPVALFPALAADRFGSVDRTGWLLSALAVGGLVAGLLSGRLTASPDPLRWVVGGGCAWGLALALVAVVPGVWACLALVVVAGAADTASVVARGALVQRHAPEEFLGRISALEGVVGVAGPGVGNLRAGAVAQWTSPSVALVSGGVAAAAVVVALGHARGRRPAASG
jgi:MFS family permease